MVKQPENSASCIQGRLSQYIAIAIKWKIAHTKVAAACIAEKYMQRGNLVGCITERIRFRGCASRSVWADTAMVKHRQSI